MTAPAGLRENVPLAPFTTLDLGGPARYLFEAASEERLFEALAWATEEGLPTLLMGGGSNLVIADGGFPGLVVAVRLRGVDFGPRATVQAAAGEDWDGLVAATVDAGLSGLECLSGIPGTVGATPIQNVGAYGAQISDSLATLRVLDRASGQVVRLGPEDVDFGYRDSRLKRNPDRWVVLSVTLALEPGGLPLVRYPELAAVVGARASAQEVRLAVLSLRRKKSMVLAPDDDNRRSVGSFFMNPVVEVAVAEDVAARAQARGLPPPPRYFAGEGRVKLAAAWLIEQSGFERGTRRGPVGLSSRHALALVHHGGGTTSALLAFADEIRAGVRAHFGVELEPEPRIVGQNPRATP